MSGTELIKYGTELVTNPGVQRFVGQIVGAPIAEASAWLARLERDAVDRARADAAPPVDPPPTAPFRLLAADPAEAQSRREGEALLGAMRAAGVGHGEEWLDGPSLTGGNR